MPSRQRKVWTPVSHTYGFDNLTVGEEIAIDLTGRITQEKVRSAVASFNEQHQPKKLTVHKPRGEFYCLVKREV